MGKTVCVCGHVKVNKKVTSLVLQAQAPGVQPAIVAESHSPLSSTPTLNNIAFSLPRHLCRQVFNFKQEKTHQVFEAPGGS